MSSQLDRPLQRVPSPLLVAVASSRRASCLGQAMAGLVLVLALVWSASLSRTYAQDSPESNPAAIRLGDTAITRWRIGVVIKATGSMKGITATTPIFMDWPEQSVKVIQEEISPAIKSVSYRILDGGVKQMVVSIPRLEAGETASAIVTLEVSKRMIEGPETTDSLVLPSKASKELAKYLGASPFIETGDAKLRTQAQQIVKEASEVPWERTKVIFDWVRENIHYKFAEEIKPAVAALKDKQGDCEELTSLFVAFCRVNKIPARAVWVPGHCYPEFYLQDAQGQGHWYPCQAAGAAHDFGRMPEVRPILQKGDNFKVPEEKTAQRYVKQFLKAANADSNPEVRFILEQIKVEETEK